MWSVTLMVLEVDVSCCQLVRSADEAPHIFPAHPCRMP